MTKAREWPNNARESRDEAAQDLNQVIKCLSYCIHNRNNMTLDDRISKIALALIHAQNAIRWLEKAGAPTQPIECGQD